MTDRLLLDTYIALWLDCRDDRVRPSTRSLIDGCWRNGGTVFLSAVTAWEIAVLVDAGRIDLDIPVEAWIERFVGRPGVEAAALGHRAACRGYQLHHLEHRDPADASSLRRRLSSPARWSPMMRGSPVSARHMAVSTGSRSGSEP